MNLINAITHLTKKMIICAVLTFIIFLVGGPVYEDFGADDVPEGQEHLHQLSVPKLLRQKIQLKKKKKNERIFKIKKNICSIAFSILLSKEFSTIWNGNL